MASEGVASGARSKREAQTYEEYVEHRNFEIALRSSLMAP